MNAISRWFESMQGGGFVKGSSAGLREVLLGWRSLFLGGCGMLLGFGGAMANDGIGVRLVLLGIGIVSVPLTVASWKQMKKSRTA
ncbi:hypothetical protein [Streptomyces sp. WM4235]|uniref:hypothetical protein n=1 Tax=Streptomyces sp. WM4235 TaxID=1415551 RepID=UPI00131A651E|nr:hypothetical protein [Streptomyces sp. WM4235]